MAFLLAVEQQERRLPKQVVQQMHVEGGFVVGGRHKSRLRLHQRQPEAGGVVHVSEEHEGAVPIGRVPQVLDQLRAVWPLVAQHRVLLFRRELREEDAVVDLVKLDQVALGH